MYFALSGVLIRKAEMGGGSTCNSRGITGKEPQLALEMYGELE